MQPKSHLLMSCQVLCCLKPYIAKQPQIISGFVFASLKLTSCIDDQLLLSRKAATILKTVQLHLMASWLQFKCCMQ